MLLAALLALLPTLNAQPDRFGLPACTAPNQELAHRTAFTLCFDSSYKTPVWTVYELTPQTTTGSALRPKRFRHDSQLTGPSAYDVDYKNSGFSRGHMVPVSDLTSSQAAVDDSFLLSNAVPQNQTVNQSTWRRLENTIHALADSGATLIIFTGPIYDCPEIKRIGPNQVAVPCATFKAVLSDHTGARSTFAAIVPNSSDATLSLSAYKVSIDELERRSGFHFPALDKTEHSKPQSEPTTYH